VDRKHEEVIVFLVRYQELNMERFQVSAMWEDRKKKGSKALI